jgi:hypothetical protein
MGMAYAGCGLSYTFLDATGFIYTARTQLCLRENRQNSEWKWKKSARAFAPEDKSHWEGDAIFPQRG